MNATAALVLKVELIAYLYSLTERQEMLEEIVRIALQSGIQYGSIQIVDSVHSIAKVNTYKDHQRQDQGKRSCDPDARWGVKHKRKVKTEDGKEEEQVQYFYVYKAHVSLNAENGLITSLEGTSGEAYDGHHFTSLVDHDLEQELPVEIYTASPLHCHHAQLET